MSSDSESCTSPTPSSGSGSGKSSTKRCNKPEMERKRRERINISLNVLKQLVLDALKKDTSQYSKLEKADILEMTVKHLRDLQRGQLVKAASADASVVGKYRAGFTECASEVTRYLGSVDGVKPEVRDSLMSHLSGCVQRVHTTPAHLGTQPQQQQQSTHSHYQTAPTPTSNIPIYQSQSPVPVPATRPIQIQIPVATSPASLPGAGVQALQMAIPNAVSAAAAAGTNITYFQSRVPQPQPPTGSHAAQSASSPRQASSPPCATYSPVSAQQPGAYMAAFQVIPNAQTAFMLPQGQLAATPIYAVSTSPAQQAQLQQLILSQMAATAAAGATTTQTITTHNNNTTPVTSAAPAASTATAVAPPNVGLKRRAEEELQMQHPRHLSSNSGRAVKKMMTSYSPKVVTSYNAKVAINDAIRDEKVWRPW